MFHPSTVDASFVHNGEGVCEGIKNKEGKWNTAPHKSRIVSFGEEELRILAKTFEDSDNWESAKLISMHHKDEILALKAFSLFKFHVSDNKKMIKTCFDETIDRDRGVMIRNTCYPDWEKQQMIYSGPHFFVSNPMYKTPRKNCILNSDYDIINLGLINDQYSARTNYTPSMPLQAYRNLMRGFKIGQDKYGNDLYDYWMDYYKLAFRKMLSQEGERTLICAVLPRKTAHINGVISIAFSDGDNTVDMASLCSSIPLDYYIKKVGASNLMPQRMENLPLGVESCFKSALRIRTLRLNCINSRYKELWEELWDKSYSEDQWSINDIRLSSWDSLTKEWNHNTPLRNYFERRQALVEIDVISAMALGLTLDELIMMYEIQFAVLQQNENDTWYDQKGNIIFTCSKGLIGVGVDRPVWNTIKDLQAGETYVHTIDPKKSELYGGQQVTYYAPFDKCDRIADYRRAWAFFEKRFNAE